MNRVIPGSLVIYVIMAADHIPSPNTFPASKKHVAIENHSEEFFVCFNFIVMKKRGKS